jgi:hypothetical protein
VVNSYNYHVIPPLTSVLLSNRLIAMVSTNVSALTRTTNIACELDSHADTCVAGSNFVALYEPSRFVNVHGYSPELAPIKDIPITTVGTTWVNPANGQAHLLIIHEYIYFGTRLNHSLLCPNQMRHNGIVVHDTPTQFDPQSSTLRAIHVFHCYYVGQSHILKPTHPPTPT